MTAKEDYLFLAVKIWLYNKLQDGSNEIKSMDQFVRELKGRFEQACKDFIDRDEYHTEKVTVPPKKVQCHPVQCKTSSPIIERLMQRVTPETLAEVKRVMIQEVIENKTAEYEARFKRFDGPEETLKPRVCGYNDGLNDMFAFLEDLTEQPQDNGHR